MNEILDYWNFFEPDNYSDIYYTANDIPKEWLQIFYIGRCIFGSNTPLTIKSHLKQLLERKEIFAKEEKEKKGINEEDIVTLKVSDSVDIGRISSIQEVSYILPREFVINTEEIFLKKLINKELYKKEFVDHEGLSVSELVYGKENELNRRQKVYILFDNSSSMNGDRLNKLYAAKSICFEYLKRVKKENPQIYFRYFNSDTGTLLKISKEKHIKELIKYIIDLNTFDCYETRIGDALTTAISDINNDPELKQAEILMITDGLGEVPSDIEEQLGKIKFNMILISDLNTDRLLKVFPDEEALKNELDKIYTKLNTNKDEGLQQIYAQFGIKDMPTFRESILKLPQIFRLKEISEIFIKIDSFLGEKFKFSNPYEIELIREIRKQLDHKLKSNISNKEKYEIFQRAKFILKYLKMVLSNHPPKELQSAIKKEIKEFQILLKGFTQDEWFVMAVKSSKSTQKIKIIRDKGNKYKNTLKRSKQPFILVFFKYLIQNLTTLYKTTTNMTSEIIHKIYQKVILKYRRFKLKRKFNYIDNKIYRILNDQ